MAALFTAALALLATASAQFIAPPKDLISKKGAAGINVRYKQVPNGICELNPKVKSFTGYADVGKDQHLFFWFFEAREVDPTKAPLTVWINGGPGASSMIGLFQELGPCFIDSELHPYNNPYSWTQKSNMIFIDQPVTVGFSYSKTTPGVLDPQTDNVTALPDTNCPVSDAGNCGTFSVYDKSSTANSTLGAADNFWKALQGFMGAFPQYSRRGFHFTTESYGGHYGPVFSEYFEQQNAKNIPGAKQISLESVNIGNGWYDPILQYQAYYQYLTTPGNTYDFKPLNETTDQQMRNALYGKGNCLDQLRQCASTGANSVCAPGDSYCAQNVENVFDIVTGRDEYDIRYLNPDPFPPSFFVDYLNKPEVLKAIGAYTNYTEFSASTGDAFFGTGDDGREDGTIEALQALLKQGVRVMLYAGDADYNCNWLGGEAVAKEVNYAGFSKAGYADLQTSDGIVHGVVKQSDTFSFLRIYYSGHEVPFYQPLAALEIFNRAISGVDIATGKQHVEPGCGYLTRGPAKSTFREGNSTIQYEVVPATATYNTTTHAPNPYSKSSKARLSKRTLKKRHIGGL